MLKAIYVVEFRERIDPEKVTDKRRIVEKASKLGFAAAVNWAQDHCEKYEFVAGVQMAEVERL